MLNQITNPTEYINAVSKLLPYVLSKIKAKEEQEHFDPGVKHFDPGTKTFDPGIKSF